MGVGVFSENFGGFGETFIIDRMEILSRSNYYADSLQYMSNATQSESVKKIAEWLEVENLSALFPAFLLAQSGRSIEYISEAFQDASKPIIARPKTPSLEHINGTIQFCDLSLELPTLNPYDLEVLQDTRDHLMWCEDVDEILRDDIRESVIDPLVREANGLIHDRATYDCDMRVLAEIGRPCHIEVTIKEWEAYDWVIGVAVTPHLRDAIDDYRSATIQERREFSSDYGLGPATLEKVMQTGIQRLSRYLRLQFKSMGFDVQYKTSGYTTSSYRFPKNMNTTRDRAFERFVAWTKKTA